MGYFLDSAPGASGHRHVFIVLTLFSVAGVIASLTFIKLSRSKNQNAAASVIACVGHGFAQGALWQRPGSQLAQVRFDLVEHRRRCCRAKLAPRVDRAVMRLVFNIIELPDPLQHLVCFTWIASYRIKELASGMRPTGNFDDLGADAREHRVVARVGVGVQVT